MAQGIPYWLSCYVHVYKFHVKNLVFKYSCLSDQLDSTGRPVTV